MNSLYFVMTIDKHEHSKRKTNTIGGAEDKGSGEIEEFHRDNLLTFELGILRRIVEEAGGPTARIEVITTASTIPYEVGKLPNAFGKIGCTNIGLMHIRNRDTVNDNDYMKRIKTATA